MTGKSNVSGHWTDEQLISYLYGSGPEDHHLQTCDSCKARASFLQGQRRQIDTDFRPDDEVSTDFLAAQRRAIYARVTHSARGWAGIHVRGWASAAATVLILGGGLFIYEQNHSHEVANGDTVTDAQLAQEMSQLSQTVEPEPGAPLQALFDE